MARRNQGPRLKWLSKRNCYYIVWTEAGRSRERSTGTTDRKQAEIALREWFRLNARHTGPRDPSELLVTEALTDYAIERGPKLQARERLAFAVEALTPFWKAHSIAAITSQTCEEYIDYRKKSRRAKHNRKQGISIATIRRELGTLRAAVNYAYKRGRISRPVFIELPEPPKPMERWLTRAEMAALLRAARTPQARLYLPLFILLGLYTGRPKEAILSLRWPQVNLDGNYINFNLEGRAETNKKRGIVRIPDRLKPHLVRARRRGSELGYVININGKAVQDIKKGFAAACTRAGLRGVTPHSLRHTAATWLMQAGVSIWEGAGFLAMSPDTLRKVYGHHHPDYMRDAANAFRSRPRNVRGI